MRIHLFVILLLVSKTVFAGDEGRNLSHNKWANITPNKWMTHDLTPAFKAAYPTGYWGSSDGFSDNAYRPDTGTVLIWTNLDFKSKQRKSGFYANGGVEWNPRTDHIKVFWYTNWHGGSSGDTMAYLLPEFESRPTPTPRHCYDVLAYVPSEKSLYTMLGANVRMRGKLDKNKDPNVKDLAKSQFARDREGTWRLDLDSGKWTLINHNVSSIVKLGYEAFYEHHLEYWPARNKLVFLDPNGKNFCLFDIKSQKWEKSGIDTKSPGTKALYGARSTWDSKRDLWVFRNKNKVIVFNPSDGSFKELPDPFNEKPFSQKDKKVTSQGICYISKHDVYFVPGPTARETKIYSPEANRWDTINGGDVDLFNNGYCQYDVKGDLVVMTRHHQVVIFRYMP